MIEENNFQLSWLPKKTFEILVIVPLDKISSGKEKAIEEAGKTLEIKGFREGKAPANIVAQNLGDQKILELTLQKLIPEYFQAAITKFNLRPIVTPKVQIVSAKENEPWQIKFTSCEEPEVKLGNYKEEVKKIKAAESIWVPGKDGNEKDAEKKKEESREEKLQKIIDFLAKNILVEVSDLLIDEEVTRKLSNLVEQTQKLGITVDQYLASIGKTVEKIREEFAASAKENLSLEFILGAISDSEKIEVKEEEIQKMINEAKEEEEKKALESQKYLIATLLRRQKTLDFLASL